jgi:CheY-like chemotaxis protein
MELEFAGYAALVCQDALARLTTARRVHPEAILSDLKVPGLDGYQLAQQIRQTPELANVPLIALTGCSRPRDIQRAVSSGFTAHVTKPANPDALAHLTASLVPRDTLQVL